LEKIKRRAGEKFDKRLTGPELPKQKPNNNALGEIEEDFCFSSNYPTIFTDKIQRF
jgi:hypothetical protein